MSKTTKLINEGLLDKENLQYVKGVLMNMDKTGKELPGLMEETRTSIVSMKETIQDARKIIDGVEDKLERLDPAIEEIPSTLTALRKASDHIASVTADARKNQGFLGLLLYDARFRANAQGIHSQPEGLRHSPLPEPERASDQTRPARRFFRQPTLTAAHNSA